jgi:hypothetical protein
MHDESTLLSLLASAGFDDPRTERVPIIWDDWSGDDTAAGDGMWTRVLSEDQLLMDAYTLATPQRRTAFEDASSALLGRSLSLRSTIETVDMLVASARRPR